MEGGNVLQCDDPQTIYQKPANLAIARYFSDFNMVEGSVANGVFSSDLFEKPCSLPDGDATAMVRMAAIALRDSGDGVEYRVVKIDYLGDAQRLVLERSGVELVTQIETRDGLKTGDAVRVAIDLDRVLLFPERRS